MPHRKGKSQTLLNPLPQPANDAEVPLTICPTCGRDYDDAPLTMPFTPGRSAALDWVEVLAQDLAHLKQVLEEVAL